MGVQVILAALVFGGIWKAYLAYKNRKVDADDKYDNAEKLLN